MSRSKPGVPLQYESKVSTASKASTPPKPLISVVKCPKCDGSMVGGTLLDQSDGRSFQSEWIEGSLELNFFGFVKKRGRQILPVQSFRCEKCGYLELYAGALRKQ